MGDLPFLLLDFLLPFRVRIILDVSLKVSHLDLALNSALVHFTAIVEAPYSHFDNFVDALFSLAVCTGDKFSGRPQLGLFLPLPVSLRAS